MKKEFPLHPYRHFLIQMLFFEKFLLKMSLLHRKAQEISPKEEFTEFLEKYAPSKHASWAYFYDHYMIDGKKERKPDLSELVHYMLNEGLTNYRIQRTIHTSPNTLGKLSKQSPTRVLYEPDPIVDDLITLFSPIKSVLMDNIFYGRL